MLSKSRSKITSFFLLSNQRSDGGIIERSVAEKPLNGDQGNGESKNRNDVKQANENLKKTIKVSVKHRHKSAAIRPLTCQL